MKLRWRIFAVFSFLYALAYFYRVAMAVLADDLSREMSLTPSQLGTLSGVFFYAFAFVQIPLGPLLDRYGGKITVLFSGILTTAGIIVFAFSQDYTQAVIGRILIGAGSASVLMGALRVFTNWFDAKEFGRISGFIIAVGNLGNIMATAPLAIASNLMGWRNIFLFLACLQMLALVSASYVVSERPDPLETKQHKASLHQMRGILDVLSTPSYWLISFSAFNWYASYMAVQGLWGGPYLMEVTGLSKEGAGRILLATSAGFLSGCLFVGDFTERITGSPKRTMIAGQFALLILMSLFLGPMEKIPKFMLTGVFFAIGIAVSTGVAVYPLIRESFPSKITGTALTSVNFFILLGAATMQQGMGFIISGFSKTAAGGYPADAYNRAFTLPISLLAISTLLFIWTRDTRS